MSKFTPSYNKLLKRRKMLQQQAASEGNNQNEGKRETLSDSFSPKPNTLFDLDPAFSPDAPTNGEIRSKARDLDQFYTRPEVASMCMEKIRQIVPIEDISLWIEPSAGTGIFLDIMPEPKRGFDIDAEHAGNEVEIQNFLTWDYHGLPRGVATVGNPPFGKNSSLALEFIKQAAKFSDWICMILPRTFEKETMQNKIPRNFELVEDSMMVLEPYSFMHDNEPYDVPCCFQIWRKLPVGEVRGMYRQVRSHPDFSFVNEPEEADFAFQRVGVKAGMASVEGLKRSWKSNHFIKASEGVDWKALMDDFNSIDWKSISGKTAGNPSISKGEMVAALSVIRPPRTVANTDELNLLDQMF